MKSLACSPGPLRISSQLVQPTLSCKMFSFNSRGIFYLYGYFGMKWCPVLALMATKACPNYGQIILEQVYLLNQGNPPRFDSTGAGLLERDSTWNAGAR
jgi:hypothetical protein